ncbi:hypothetical protein [Seohaeicola zhoushanensis]|uniref:Uncharacterized protein n=1 Tax=Seohaeicola zhoushanensis TaxID=1569283 RepID=A0A8J3M4F6_9RHOB|nr:hypothetical protein [Seohaeicola zhoushanensis]GHF37865.1 hypothetical protein GCM10017056_07270 [Seohaeicola zhoushanensis]
MIENPTNMDTLRAMNRAHEERGKAMRAMLAWLFRRAQPARDVTCSAAAPIAAE